MKFSSNFRLELAWFKHMDRYGIMAQMDCWLKGSKGYFSKEYGLMLGDILCDNSKWPQKDSMS